MSKLSNLLQNVSYDGFALANIMNEKSEMCLDAEPILFKNSIYYDNESFIKLFKHTEKYFTVISLNCQSLNAKFNELKIYIELFKVNNIVLNAICLQETWLSEQDDNSLLQLDDYNLIVKGKSCSAHGGVAIYLHKCFDYKVIKHKESTMWDGIFVKVMEKSNGIDNKSLIIGNIYRPPQQNCDIIKSFSEEMLQLFQQFQNYKNVIFLLIVSFVDII